MSVEFLDTGAGDDSGSEDLTPPPRRDWLRRLWLPLAAAGLLVVALVTIDVVPGHSPKPRPTDTPRPVSVGRLVFLDPSIYPDAFVPFPSPSLAREVPVLRGVAGLPDILLTGGQLPCPMREACYLNRLMPPAVQAALKQTFPHMEPAHILTLEAQPSGEVPYVWFRQITLVSNTLDVTIRVVTPARGGVGFSDTIRYGTRSVNYIVAPNSGYAVIVHVEAPTGESLPLSKLSLLAVDERLWTRLP